MNNLERRVAEMEDSNAKQSNNHKLVVCGTPEEVAVHRQSHTGQFRYVITGVTRAAVIGPASREAQDAPY